MDPSFGATNADEDLGSGSGSSLPIAVLTLAGLSTLVATVLSTGSIYLHLKNYRKPMLQRMVIRIILMVPIYGVSSLISLFSLQAAFFIDAVRDIYEAFVIYCFFDLLLQYLGGEREFLISMQGRPPKPPVFPVNLWKRELDISDPHTFLFLKRGILQYVQVKPILAIVTMILKAVGRFNEGDLTAKSGYLYISVVYNTSITLALYCLAVFWVCIHDDIKPFRPVPKFFCVKGILFFSFWQGLAISIFVAAGLIKHLGPYTDPERISTGLTDALICMEMPFFAVAHQYAFSFRDFSEPTHVYHYVARMPMYYAFRDAFGLVDVVQETKATLQGQGMDYREFEPSEGHIHQGDGRDRRIRAGLRYSKGGKMKYWLPMPTQETAPAGPAERMTNKIVKKVISEEQEEEEHAPLLPHQQEDVVHLAPDMLYDAEEVGQPTTSARPPPSLYGAYSIPLKMDEADEELYSQSRRYLFGDYNYPTVDVSSEFARGKIWDEEERVLRDERGAWFSDIRGAKGKIHLGEREGPAWSGYGAVSHTHRNSARSSKIDGERREERLVDHEDLRVPNQAPSSRPASSSGDVKLKWTRQFAPASSRTSSLYSSSNGAGPSHPPAPVSRGTPSPSSSFVRTRTSSSSTPAAAPTTRTRTTSKPLPPDAVDLVVASPPTSPANAHPPTTSTSSPPPQLQKVYRKGFTDPSSGMHGEVDLERRVGGLEEGEEVVQAIEQSPDVMREAREEGVARTGTPPVHVKFGTDFEDNPWA
ncbi:DUF300 domain-containing protein [Flagelloscypha sp. PMI_526]|nr:DUF300 domain-containing protein [Flagelloscypha sp. PMI_526]